jgi:hypothetical protein
VLPSETTTAAQAVAWEERWSLTVALATLAAVALLIASFVVISSLGGGGEAESLRTIHAHGGRITLASLLQSAGFVLLLAPLVYLFRAALARSEKMRARFLPLVALAPLALAAGSLLNGFAARDAASDFLAGRSAPSISTREASKDCRTEQHEDASSFREEFGHGGEALSRCAAGKLADDSAKNAISHASLRRVSEIFQFIGAFALAFALVYSSLNAMRVGLLTRFWGSLGIAMGVASVLGLFQLTLIWFLYFALLIRGWIPRGRPPAWAEGKTIPWPTPGEKAATELSPSEPNDPSEAEQPEQSEAGNQEKPPDEEQSR